VPRCSLSSTSKSVSISGHPTHQHHIKVLQLLLVKPLRVHTCLSLPLTPCHSSDAKHLMAPAVCGALHDAACYASCYLRQAIVKPVL
jgi:hypothetical protein